MDSVPFWPAGCTVAAIETINGPRSSSRPGNIGKIKVCHLAMGDLWAGAEVQLSVLLTSLARMPDFEVSAVLFNEGRLANELRAHGVDTHVIPELRHNTISIIKQLLGYFSRRNIDILHTHKYKDNILGALSSVYRRIPRRVRTIHGLPEPFSGFQAVKMGIYQLIDNGINRWMVDHILAVSLDLRRHLSERFDTAKISCVHNAIDSEQIRVSPHATALRNELKVDRNAFLIGTMGRLMPVKGLDCFLRAARIVKDERKDVKFVVVGDGPLRGFLDTLASEYHLEKDVLFLGHRHDNHDLLALMDIFVLSSLSEGIPMVLLEALALARPVVASRVGGISEVVEHGISGLLVAPGKEGEIAQSCLSLMDSDDFARGLGLAGRRRVEEHFSAGAMADGVARVYRTLVRGGES
jgi:L-malate glycosyltransferase